MGSLITEVPLSETVNLIELLGAAGVTREHLTRLRQPTGNSARNALISLIKFGHRDDPIPYEADPEATEGFEVSKNDSITIRGWRWNREEFEEGLIALAESGGPLWSNRVSSPCLRPATAHILDFLLANQDLIPKRLKRFQVLFAGTTYLNYSRADRSDLYYYRALVWNMGLALWEDRYVRSNDIYDRNLHRFATIKFQVL